MNGKELINSESDIHWPDCRICKDIFLRIRQTRRYCYDCGDAACEGEHGSFIPGGALFRCVACQAKHAERTPVTIGGKKYE